MMPSAMLKIKSHPKTYARILIACAVGILFALYLFGAIQNYLRMVERGRREQERFVNKLTEEWIEGEKVSLASRQTSHVHFYSTANSDSWVNRLAGMPEIRSLTFESTDLTDHGVSIIAQLPNLEKLTVYGGSTSNAGLESLSQNQSLRTLHLVNVDISDSGLAFLQSMHNLENLTIYRGKRFKSKLTDFAVHVLATLKQLKKLNVGGGWLSKPAIFELKTLLPDCQIAEDFADDEW